MKLDNEAISANFPWKSVFIGQKVELNCKSEGGNPIVSLSFTRNGTKFGPGPCRCLNTTHSFLVTKEDHGAVLGCSAENDNKMAISQSVELRVLCKLHENTWYFFKSLSKKVLRNKFILRLRIYRK